MEKKNENERFIDETINHWMIRAKSSGSKPEDLWEDAVAYFMWCEANPIFKQEVIKQTGAVIMTKFPRPFNLPALCIHCGVTPQYISDIARNSESGNYFFVANKIMQVIYAQNFEYSMVGIFNANMAIRKLDLGGDDGGMKSTSTINIEVIKIEGTPQLSNSEFEK